MPDSNFEFLNRHINVSYETFEKLSLYHDLLCKWQPKVNLVGPDTIKDSWNRHFLDSLQLLKYIDLDKKIIDLGSGAGFPGMALAIYGANNVHLIESDGKKITFLKEVARITETKISIHHSRIEEKPTGVGDVIVSRALANIQSLLQLSSFFVSHETKCLFHKGRNWSIEITDAEKDWTFDYVANPSISDAQGVILQISNIAKRGICPTNPPSSLPDRAS